MRGPRGVVRWSEAGEKKVVGCSSFEESLDPTALEAAQPALLHLAGRGDRELVDDLDAGRLLEAREPDDRVRTDRLLEVGAGLVDAADRDDVRNHGLAGHPVGR